MDSTRRRNNSEKRSKNIPDIQEIEVDRNTSSDSESEPMLKAEHELIPAAIGIKKEDLVKK